MTEGRGERQGTNIFCSNHLFLLFEMTEQRRDRRRKAVETTVRIESIR